MWRSKTRRLNGETGGGSLLGVGEVWVGLVSLIQNWCRCQVCLAVFSVIWFCPVTTREVNKKEEGTYGVLKTARINGRWAQESRVGVGGGPRRLCDFKSQRGS